MGSADRLCKPEGLGTTRPTRGRSRMPGRLSRNSTTCSGNGYHLTHGVVRPVTGAFTINSLNVIKYDGSSDCATRRSR